MVETKRYCESDPRSAIFETEEDDMDYVLDIVAQQAGRQLARLLIKRQSDKSRLDNDAA